jgi:hypothetical protein
MTKQMRSQGRNQVGTSNDELPDGLGLSEVDMVELKEALQKISSLQI